MTWTISEYPAGTYRLADDRGNLARTTASEVYLTSDRTEAEEAAAYLNQPRNGLEKRCGSHRLKSTFGVL